MTRDQLISDSEMLIQWMDEQINGLEVSSDLRSRLAVGCLDMALEHQKAIVLLITKQLYGSVFALVRSIFEAYVRGVWLHKCATEVDIVRFENGHVPSFQKLLSDIETSEELKSGILSRVKNHSWKSMSGFTHTGFEQIVRRHTEITIEPNYDDPEILEAANFANAIGCLAAIAISDVAGNLKLANAVLGKLGDIWLTEP